MISVTCGFHSVIVHVLSNIIVSTLQSVSKGSHPLISIPCSAHLPVPTINAVGVASPSAHGQAITITAAKYNNEDSNPAPTIKNRIQKVSRAKRITVGTKIADILSANH